MHVHPCPDASQFLNMEPSSEFHDGKRYMNHLNKLATRYWPRAPLMS